MAAIVVTLGMRLPPPRGGPDRCADAFIPLLLIALAWETGNAWAFSQLADPGAGVYFADDTSRFTAVNRATWVEVILLGGWIALWQARYFRTA
jgi:hypothetical protein